MQISDDGIIKPQYAWRGITLNNNEHLTLYPRDETRGLYAVKDTNMSIRYQLNRSANHYAWLRAYYTPPYEWRSRVQYKQ
ncbi:hypothetical protein C7121_06940 [Paenibacillus glucanolyticus]|jgi:hypothetical protein|nr:hypothetical protein A3958_08870 [Paenibacillus glucanolyticus]AVV55889.1 hypothetical protein C7121_06940 [Paenibacillus glucanolyticus]ETT38477.1 hypothetical protein C169_12722 [Paenibacillus sp. FSL R5-808]